MTPDEIKKEAPEGATHYADRYCLEYFKFKGNKIWMYDDRWYPLIKDQYGFIRSVTKPL